MSDQPRHPRHPRPVARKLTRPEREEVLGRLLGDQRLAVPERGCCEACHGTGAVGAEPCSDCYATGHCHLPEQGCDG